MTSSHILGFKLKSKVVDKLRVLYEHMIKFNAVMIKLHSPQLNILDVRKLFDHILKSYPTMTVRLAPDAAIVHSPVFESALIAVLKKVC